MTTTIITTNQFRNFYFSLETDEKKAKFRDQLFLRGRIREARIYAWIRPRTKEMEIEPIIANFIKEVAAEFDSTKAELYLN